MRYVIADLDGETLDTFESQRDAVVAMLGMVRESVSAGCELVLLAFLDDGSAFGKAVRGDELYARIVRWQVPGSETNRPSHVEISPRLRSHVQASDEPVDAQPALA